MVTVARVVLNQVDAISAIHARVTCTLVGIGACFSVVLRLIAWMALAAVRAWAIVHTLPVLLVTRIFLNIMTAIASVVCAVW